MSVMFAVFHSFSCSEESARILARRGVYMAFNGIVTFKNAEKTRRAAKTVPDELLLVETDCPYLTPEPHRGKLNYPAYVRYTAEKAAALRGEPFGTLAQNTTANAYRFYYKMR